MKISIDTNVLIRLLTEDQPKLLKKAKNLVSQYSTKEIFISYAVIIETYFVLLTHYSWHKEQILQALMDIINTDEFFVEHQTAVYLAVIKCQKGMPFADALIGEVGTLRNLKTFTFDKALRDNINFEVIK